MPAIYLDYCRDCRRKGRTTGSGSCTDCVAAREQMVNRLMAGEPKPKLMREMKEQFKQIGLKPTEG